MVRDCKAAEFYYGNLGSEPPKGTYSRKTGNQYVSTFTFNDRSKVVCYRDGSMSWAGANGIYLGVKTAVVGNCKPGQIIQIMHLGLNDYSGNYYKLWYRLPGGKFRAFRQFTGKNGEYIDLHPDNKCRLVKEQIEGF